MSGEHAPDEPWRFGIDITVGLHESFWDRAHAREDAICARAGMLLVLDGSHGAMMS